MLARDLNSCSGAAAAPDAAPGCVGGCGRGASVATEAAEATEAAVLSADSASTAAAAGGGCEGLGAAAADLGTLRLAGVVRESIVDGPGLRFTIFCQGCPHGCEGCHNPATHDFAGGYDCDIAKILAAIDENPLLDGVTFSGGEPMCQPEAFLTIAREVKKRGLNIVAFTGYLYEDLLEMAKTNAALSELLPLIDLLVDGPFVLNERDLTLKFRGSANQRVIDVPKSLASGEVCIAEEHM